MGRVKKQKERRVSYNAQVGTLFISIDGKESAYYLDVLRHDMGAEFRCVRLTPFSSCRRDDQPEHYDVAVGMTVESSTCECRGFLRWAHCKHVESLLALRAAKRI